MAIDPTYLRRHYASLSDEGLLEVDETELVDEARRIFDEEVAQRGLSRDEEAADDEVEAEDEALGEAGSGAPDFDGGPEPEWLDEAALAGSFVSQPGSSTPTDTAVDASDALHAAGIPCYVVTGKVDPPEVSPKPQLEFRLMVPSEWLFEARSVLDKEIFNQEVEEYWRTHFQVLSDDDMRALNLEVVLAGLKDRIERITRVYNEELKQRA